MRFVDVNEEAFLPRAWLFAVSSYFCFRSRVLDVIGVSVSLVISLVNDRLPRSFLDVCATPASFKLSAVFACPLRDAGPF